MSIPPHRDGRIIPDPAPESNPDGRLLNRGEIGRRIVVIGTSGSGKTTAAAAVAQRLGVPHVELDALHWESNWTPAPVDVLRERVRQALSGDAWTVDGNYGKVRDLVWTRADTVVWLDYSLPVIMSRLLRRTVRRVVTREELWGGNRESWRQTFMSRESILLWALQSYKRRRRQYPELLARPEYAHLAVVHLRTPGATRRWLSTIDHLPRVVL
jgi:adenylate kinase family enzyme